MGGGGSSHKLEVCFESMFSEGTPWQLQNPMVHVVPILVQELLFVMLIIRLLMVLCKPLRQPRFVAELIVSPASNYIYCYMLIHNNLLYSCGVNC